MDVAVLARIVVGTRSLPDNFVLKIVFAHDLVEHDLDVMRGVPVTVVVEAPRLLEDTCQFYATGPHEVDVGFCGFMAILEGALFFCLAPENLIIPVGIERWIDVAQINASVRKFAELVKAVPTVNDLGIDKD
jgi:hypothetical protein